MRDTEGVALVRELSNHLAAIEVELGWVEGRAPDRLVAERDRLRNAVATLLDGGRLDESRLAQQNAVGRQLGFLGQEMLREINTIGSKANDLSITQAVIRMKGELEKFREQVENLE